MSWSKNKKKYIGLGIITIIIIFISSAVIYSNIIKPKQYDDAMNKGQKYLSEKKYKEASESFQNADQINDANEKVKLGLAKSYIGLNNVNKAATYLEQAQKLDMDDKKLTSEITNIISSVKPEMANELLNSFARKIDISNTSEQFKNNLAEAIDEKGIDKFVKDAKNLYNTTKEDILNNKNNKNFEDDLADLLNEADKIKNDYNNNKDKIDKVKDYYDKNKDKIDKIKNYYDKNKDKIDKIKNYYDKNKDKIDKIKNDYNNNKDKVDNIKNNLQQAIDKIESNKNNIVPTN